MSAPYAERPFTVGNVVGESLSLYRRFFVRFFVLALIVFAVVDLIPAIAATASSDAARALWFVVGVVVILVGFVWLEAALIAQVDDVRDGRIDSSIGEIFERVRNRLPQLIAVGLLTALAIVAAAVLLLVVASALHVAWLGVVLLIAFSFFLLTRWLLAPAAIVLEKLGTVPGLRRSWQLVSGHSWQAFFLLLVTLILAAIPSAIVNSILSAIFSGSEFLRAWVASTIANALTTPFVALCWTLAYFHLRPAPSSEPQVPAGAAYVDP